MCLIFSSCSHVSCQNVRYRRRNCTVFQARSMHSWISEANNLNPLAFCIAQIAWIQHLIPENTPSAFLCPERDLSRCGGALTKLAGPYFPFAKCVLILIVGFQPTRCTCIQTVLLRRTGSAPWHPFLDSRCWDSSRLAPRWGRYGSSMETGTTRFSEKTKIARAKRPFSALSGRPGGWSQKGSFPAAESKGCWCTQAINLSAASMGCSILALPRVFAVCGMSLGSCRVWGGFGQGWQWFQSSLTLAVTFSWISRTTVLVELPPVYIRVFWMFYMTKCCKHLWVYLVYILHNSAVLNHLKFNNSIVTVWHLELHHAKPLSFLKMVGGCGALTVSMDYGGFTRFFIRILYRMHV